MTDSPAAKVLIGVPCGKLPVCGAFYHAFYGLQAPDGSIRHSVTGGSVPGNLNKLVDVALERACTHLFIVEDDSIFAPDTVMRLLAHDKLVVTGLCLNRNAPFRPYIYEDENPATGLTYRTLRAEDTGLIRVGATGMGGILINMEVFHRLKRPYFEVNYVGETEWGQDILFGKKLIEHGIEVFCDLGVTIWHGTDCFLGTKRDEKGWWMLVRIGSAQVEVPLYLFHETASEPEIFGASK